MANEQKLMNAIYDSIHSAVAGEGAKKSFFSMSHLGQAIRGVNGSSAEMWFSLLCDSAPPLETVFNAGGQALSSVYGDIVEYAKPATSSGLPPQFDEARDRYKHAKKNGYYPATAFPPDWWSPETPFEKISIDSNNYVFDEKSFWGRIDGKAKFDLGIFGTRAEVTGNVQYSSMSSETKNLKLNMEVAGIRVIRPWYEGQILALNGWKVPGVSRERYSNGKIDASNKGSFPLLTTKAVLVRNLSIYADWAEKDQKTIEAGLKASAEFRIGPFKIKGTIDIGPYREETITSSFEKGSLMTPEDVTYLQGFVCEVIPACPPSSG